MGEVKGGGGGGGERRERERERERERKDFLKKYAYQGHREIYITNSS